MTNEQWSFCAGMGTGVSIFIAGLFIGALLWHSFLLLRSRYESERHKRQQREIYDQLRATHNKNKEPKQ
jgi:uncharacterized membrane protein YciS (DUF1049 family)